ncbi:hypothetical protein B6N60_04170 [Richelia sinica FACHB-800]|uniref:Uncharacterized protein n=2 Tax=Richelia TaxID=98443 RepID=A0A975Y6N2_9NOST|nr:hypothetical protein B6N60_04170 [Richelia sinica FACHB-800]
MEEAPAPGKNQDQLIARGLQKEQYIGIFGLAIALIAAVGLLSRRVEYAIIFAFFISAILIAFFLFI